MASDLNKEHWSFPGQIVFASNWYAEDKFSFYVRVIRSNETLQGLQTNGLPLLISHRHAHKRWNMKFESIRIWTQTLVQYISNLGFCILTWSGLTIGPIGITDIGREVFIRVFQVRLRASFSWGRCDLSWLVAAGEGSAARLMVW